ncbi:single hybrid motif-containing protein [Phellopilus nigrolimitatus]|nr:single hybrid motif-containing protein [Phellopilus nigrolimitatus]
MSSRFRPLLQLTSASSQLILVKVSMHCTRRASSRIAVTLSASRRRCLHATSSRHAISNLAMPAMSPTMTEGGISQWKLKEGESFSAGDVLLEVETDKATIDVEAQDDGIIGKILLPDGSKNVAVGKVIALLAEDGDDITNLEAPKEGTSKAPNVPNRDSEPTKRVQTPQQPSAQPKAHDIQIQHTRPLFPSVQRLLIENSIENTDKIQGTGVRGMLTKGDVLAFLGKASSPLGTYKVPKSGLPGPKVAKEEAKPLDGRAIRQLIVSNFLQSSLRARSLPSSATPHDFESIIADYLPVATESLLPRHNTVPSLKQTPPTGSYFDGLI